MNSVILEKYNKWLNCATEDVDISTELISMKDNEDKIVDAFYKDLTFGTGGLRGILGAGTNRMNIYIIRKASLGLAHYLINNFKNKSIAISYDSRIKSNLFAIEAATVFASVGIKVYIYKQLMPTPLLSYAVRELGCSAGVMVTASHNPSKYNGYKVYGPDGCQITTLAAEKITKEISKIDPFKVKHNDLNYYLKNNLIEFIPREIYDNFINRVKLESVVKDKEINKDVKIVYSPLNGTGLEPVTRILKETGFNNVILVNEQKDPNGLFPTCPFPNPEIEDAMSLGIKYAKENNADLLIATDPDCDRVGIALKNKNNEFTLLSGNQVGALLLDYVCKLRLENKTMPKHPYVVKTIVTTELIDSIAKKYNVELFSVLTGFKYIGELIGKLEIEKPDMTYILGMEESYGYLSGNHVRDKDAVNGSFIIAEMFAYYKTQNKSLLGVLDGLYKEHGFYLNKLETFEFDGIVGMKKMSKIMQYFRDHVTNIGKYNIDKKLDYNNGIDGMPKSDVIKFFLQGNTVTIRPSGTEPKLKVYYSIKAKDEPEALNIFKYLSAELGNIFKN